MFYTYLRGLVVFLLWIINGNAHYHNQDKIIDQKENYIFVAPHRTWWDPVYMAFAARPKQFIFMAKKELFENRLISWWIRMCGAFPVDRENPGQKAIRYPIKMLKNSQRSLMMFPSGSRHSTEIKGGVAAIAKMAKVRIMPAVYQGPMHLKDLIKGDRVDVNFGNPIDVSDIKRLDDEGLKEVASRIQNEFDRLDEETKPLHNNKRVNPLTYLFRIPFALLALVVVILTFLFSLIGSFVWDPEKHFK